MLIYVVCIICLTNPSEKAFHHASVILQLFPQVTLFHDTSFLIEVCRVYTDNMGFKVGIVLLTALNAVIAGKGRSHFLTMKSSSLNV